VYRVEEAVVLSDYPRPHARNPALRARQLAQLSAEVVDDWLAVKAKALSTDALHRLLSILRRSIRHAQARPGEAQCCTAL
jgi:hypothetical protein